MWCRGITHKSVKWNWCGKIAYDLSPGPSSPRNVKADALSINAVRLHWQPPEDPNGGIVKYSIEYQPVGQGSFHPWVDTDDGNKTTKDVTSLNGSTLYQFRVRAFSKVPGEWSKFVQARTRGDGKWPEWINVRKTYCKAEISRHLLYFISSRILQLYSHHSASWTANGWGSSASLGCGWVSGCYLCDHPSGPFDSLLHS